MTSRQAERVQTAILLSRVRWFGVALSLFEAAFSTNPAPISRLAGFVIAGWIVLYNLPLAFTKRLPRAWIETVLVAAVGGDFLTSLAWNLNTANDPYSASYASFTVIAAEAAALFAVRGALVFAGAFALVSAVLFWLRSRYFGSALELDSFAVQASVTMLVAGFTGALGRRVERHRRVEAEAAVEARRQAGRSDALARIATHIAQTLKREYVMETVVDSLLALYPGRWHGILLLAEGHRMELKHVRGTPREVEFPEATSSSLQLVRRLLVAADLASDAGFAAAGLAPLPLLERYRSGVALGLRSVDRDFGILLSLDPAPAALTEEEVMFLSAIAGQASTALENARLYEEVESMSLTDATTALANRRAFDRRLNEEIGRAARYGLRLGLLMLDVDYFKFYNDHHGHLAGDQVLKELGEVLARKALRRVDLPYRFGGEEFAVIAPVTDAGGALALARRVCEMVREEDFPFAAEQPGGRLTVSAGVAMYPEHGATARELVDHADLALYRSKESGRDRAVLYDPAHSGRGPARPDGQN